MACLIYKGATAEDVSGQPIKEFAPVKPVRGKTRKARVRTAGKKPAGDVGGLEVHTPEQLGLTADRILKDEFRHLLVLCHGDKPPEVRLLPVTFDGGGEVFTYVNVGCVVGQPKGVRRLARAWTKREFDETYGGREFDKDDSYAGVAVKADGMTCVFGPREDSVYVNVEEAKA